MSLFISEVFNEGSGCFQKEPENLVPVEDITMSVSSAESGGNRRLCSLPITPVDMTDLVAPQCQLPGW